MDIIPVLLYSILFHQDIINPHSPYGERHSPVCGNNVTDMYNTYSNCTNLTGAPVCGENVVKFSATYNYCTNMKGNVVCGSNVTIM